MKWQTSAELCYRLQRTNDWKPVPLEHATKHTFYIQGNTCSRPAADFCCCVSTSIFFFTFFPHHRVKHPAIRDIILSDLHVVHTSHSNHLSYDTVNVICTHTHTHKVSNTIIWYYGSALVTMSMQRFIVENGKKWWKRQSFIYVWFHREKNTNDNQQKKSGRLHRKWTEKR